jgi:hypothetical protein
MKIRVEYEKENELQKLLKDLEKLYLIKDISKKYANRQPSKLTRVYVDLEVLSDD